MPYFRLRDQTNIGTKNINSKYGRNVLTAESKSMLTILL